VFANNKNYCILHPVNCSYSIIDETLDTYALKEAILWIFLVAAFFVEKKLFLYLMSISS
jgi:hypothetical protein